MVTTARILLMLILASFLVANSQGGQDPEVNAFKSIEVSSDSSSESSSDSSSEVSTLTLKKIDIDSSEISSDSTEISTQLDIFSGIEETEVAKSSEILVGGLSSETDTVPSSSATPTTESVLFPDVPTDEIPASPDHKRTTAFPKLTETPAEISSEDLTETDSKVDISSGTEDFGVSELSEILAGDLSSEIDIAPLSSATPTTESILFRNVPMDEISTSPDQRTTTFPRLTDAPVEISSEDLTETSTDFDISSGTEDFEVSEFSEILSGDLSSEVYIVPSSSAPPITESVLFPDVPTDEIPASPDHKGTTEFPRPNEAPVEISSEDLTETSTDFDISSGTEDFEVSESSEILSGDWSSGIDTLPSSSAPPITESVLFPDVPTDEIPASPDHKRTTAFPKLTETPVEISSEDLTETDSKVDISSGTEDFEVSKSSEILAGDLSSEVYIVPSSSAAPTIESVLFPDVPLDEISTSPDHNRTTAFPRPTEAPVEISSEDLTETSTDFHISSGTEDFEVSKSSEILPGDLSSKVYIVPSSSPTPTIESVLFSDVPMDEIPASPEHKRTTAFPRLTETPVEISSEDLTETSTDFDISSRTEDFGVSESSEILSSDLSSEVDIVPSSSATPSTIESVLFPDVPTDEIPASPEDKRTTAFPKLTETPVEISNEDLTETDSKVDISSGTEDFEVSKSSEILSGDLSSEVYIVPSSSAAPTIESVLFPDVPTDEIPASPEDKRTTAFPKLTETPVEISNEDLTETDSKVDISSGTEDFEVSKSSEILSGDLSSEVYIVPSSSAAPTIESVLFPDVPMDEISTSPDHNRTTAFPRPTEAPVEISSEDLTETSTDFHISSGTEDFEVSKSSEILPGDLSSEVYIVPSSSAAPTIESVLFPDVPMDEISTSPDHNRTTAFPRPTEAPVEISNEDLTETDSKVDISSGTEDFEVSKSSEILSGDLSSEVYIVPSSSAAPTIESVLFPDVPMDEISTSPDHNITTAFPRPTEAPVEISSEDLTETSTDFHISSGTEDFDVSESSEILSSDLSSEVDIVPSSSATPSTIESVLFPDVPTDEIPASPEDKRTTAFPKLTETPVEISNEDLTETDSKVDISSGTEDFEVSKSSEILSGDLSSEVYIVPSSSAAPTIESVLFSDVPMDEIPASPDHKRTTAFPRLTETPVEISREDLTETPTDFNVSSGTEDFEVSESSEILAGDLSSEVDTVPSSSATPITESVLFPDVPTDEIPASPDHNRTTAFPRPTEAPVEISSEDLTETDSKVDISSGTEDFDVSEYSEILSSDLSSEVYIVPSSSATPSTIESVLFPDVPTDEIPASPDHKRTTAFPKLIETPVEISSEDLTETDSKVDISSGTEDFEVSTDEIPASPDHNRTTAFPRPTEAPVEISSEDLTETDSKVNISFGTEDFDVSESSEILSSDLSSEVNIVPSSSAAPTIESVLFPDVPTDEIPASPDHNRTTAFPRLTETPVEISSEDLTETSTDFDISSRTEDFEVSTDEIPASPDHNRTTAFRRPTEAPVEISSEDLTETDSKVDISSGTEDFDVSESSEILSSDLSSEVYIVPSSSATPSTIESVLFPDVPTDEIPASPDHKRTTAFPKLTETPVEISSEDLTETDGKVDISSGTEDFEVSESSEILAGDLSSEVDTVPSSSAPPITESVLFPDVPTDEIPASPDHNRTTAFPRLTETPVEISSEDLTETSTDFDISSGTEDFEVSTDEIPASPDHNSTTAFPRPTEAPVEISSEDLTETDSKVDISFGTEDFDVSESSEILSSDLSSEVYIIPSSSATSTTESVLLPDVPMDEISTSPDHNRTTAFPRLTDAPVEISSEDLTETPTDFDISSGTEDFEVSKSSEILAGGLSSEIDTLPSSSAPPITESVLFPDVPTDEIPASPDHKRTTEFPRPTEAPVEISSEDLTETDSKVDISSESEEVDVSKSSEILSGDLSSEIDTVPSSSATPSTKSVLFPDVPKDEIPPSPHHKGTTESLKPKGSSDISTTPTSTQNPTKVKLMNNEIFILPSITSTEFVDSNDSVSLLEEQVSDDSNTSKLLSNTTPQEKKISAGIIFGVVLGSTVGVTLLATVVFLLYRKRKRNLFAHQHFLDDRNEPVQRLDNTTDTYNLSFGGASFFNSAVPDDPVMEKNTERTGENIQLKTIPTAYTLNKPWGVGLQTTESHFMPRTVSNP